MPEHRVLTYDNLTYLPMVLFGYGSPKHGLLDSV